MKTVAVVPAYNEEERISDVIEEVKEYVDGVLVVDDGSDDGTAEAAGEAGAEVIVHERNRGYMEALRTGFGEISSGVVVTLDADGEMDPKYIPELVGPVLEGEADLVLGRREKVPRISERFLSFLAGLKVDVLDTGTGFRALSSDLAVELDFVGVCPCGTLVLEASNMEARIFEVPVETRDIEKPRRMAWKHSVQFWHVLGLLMGIPF